MVKVLYGKKGMGKTKILVDTANELVKTGSGDVVFVDEDKKLMYDLKHEIRFIDLKDFPVNSIERFFGFVCGIISEDYDISGIFIDGLTYIVKQNADALQGLLSDLDSISEKFNIKIYISINGESDAMPEYLKAYV